MMRTLYILVILFVILVIALMALSFLYFERNWHKTYYYAVEINGDVRGGVLVDKYGTEENILYKSKEEYPYRMGRTRKNVKIVIGRRTRTLKEYEEESYSDGVREMYYLKESKKGFSFLSIAKSKTSFLEEMDAVKGAKPFNRYVLVTWIPFVDQYDFRVGGAQSFYAIRYYKQSFPPYKARITLTSIRDDYIMYDGRKVKTECLILKEKGRPQAFCWVSKKDHSIVKIEMQHEHIIIRLTQKRTVFDVEDYVVQGEHTVSRQMSFKAAGKELTGVMTRPVTKGVYPAVLLVSGEDLPRLHSSGFFFDFADYLAAHGYIVFRYSFLDADGRGKYQSISVSDEWQAMEAALDILEEYRSVDTEKIGIITHSDMCFILPHFLKNEPRIKIGCMLSPRRLAPVFDTGSLSAKGSLEEKYEIDADYEKAVFRTEDGTLEVSEESPKDFRVILGKKVFLGRIKEIIELNPIQDMWSIDIPVLLVLGKTDEMISSGFWEGLEQAMNDADRTDRTIVSFRTLGHYLGQKIDNGVIREYIKMDGEVIETVTGWLDKNLKVEGNTPRIEIEKGDEKE